MFLLFIETILHDVFRFKKYEALKIFNEPVQLITADETKRIRFNDAAIAELHTVDHNVNVVAVVGVYRTGKSLLLNRLAGVNNYGKLTLIRKKIISYNSDRVHHGQ